MNLFWVHGGPGYNSRPEELLIGERLREIFSDVLFWNHPSSLRGDEVTNTWFEYNSSLDSAFKEFIEEKGSAILVCHSFGAFSSVPIIKKYHDKIKGVVWISGTTDMQSVFRNIFSVIREDYIENSNAEAAEKIKKTLDLKNPQCDDFLRNLEPVLMNENFSHYYWTNKEAMGKFYPLMLNEWGFDLDCFVGVTSTLKEVEINQISDLPNLLCYGEDELIIDSYDEMVRAKKLFNNISVVTFSNCSHFPHLENDNKFINLLKDFTNDILIKEENRGANQSLI